MFNLSRLFCKYEINRGLIISIIYIFLKFSNLDIIGEYIYKKKLFVLYVMIVAIK